MNSDKNVVQLVCIQILDKKEHQQVLKMGDNMLDKQLPYDINHRVLIKYYVYFPFVTKVTDQVEKIIESKPHMCQKSTFYS